MGLGETLPQPRSASARARCIWAVLRVSTPSSMTTSSARPRRGGRKRQATRRTKPRIARPSVMSTRSLPSRLSRSVPEFHRVHPRLAVEGSRTVTAGGELRPAPETVICLSRQYREKSPKNATGRLCSEDRSDRRGRTLEAQVASAASDSPPTIKPCVGRSRTRNPGRASRTASSRSRPTRLPRSGRTHAARCWRCRR